MTERAVDLLALADELNRKGYLFSYYPRQGDALGLLTVQGCEIYENGVMQWELADIIRRHIAPAVGVEQGGDA